MNWQGASSGTLTLQWAGVVVPLWVFALWSSVTLQFYRPGGDFVVSFPPGRGQSVGGPWLHSLGGYTQEKARGTRASSPVRPAWRRALLSGSRPRRPPTA